MANELKIRDFREHQNITDEQAAQIFPAEVLRQGGGWGEIQGIQVYGHTGSHRDGTKGWKIHSFGGLR